MREGGQRLRSQAGHLLHRGLEGIGGFIGRFKNGAVAVGFNVKAQHADWAFNVRLQFHAVIQVEVAHTHTRLDEHIHLAAGNVVVGAIDDGPHGLFFERPAAGIDPEVAHGIERLPIGAGEQRRGVWLRRRAA